MPASRSEPVIDADCLKINDPWLRTTEEPLFRFPFLQQRLENRKIFAWKGKFPKVVYEVNSFVYSSLRGGIKWRNLFLKSTMHVEEKQLQISQQKFQVT